jgi:hypothetical protein
MDSIALSTGTISASVMPLELDLKAGGRRGGSGATLSGHHQLTVGLLHSPSN